MVAKYPTAALKQELDGHEVRIQSLEKKDVNQDACINEMCTDIKEIKDDFKDLEKWRADTDKVITKIDAFVGAGKWLLVAFCSLIITLIWSLITGQASVIFH